MVWPMWSGWTGWECSAAGNWAFSSPDRSKTLGWTISWWEFWHFLKEKDKFDLRMFCFRRTQTTLVVTRQAIPPSRPSGLSSPVLRRFSLHKLDSLLNISLNAAGAEEEASQICHKLLPPTSPGLQGDLEYMWHFLPLPSSQDLDPPFCIQNAGTEQERIPTASTCMNLLKLPDYKVWWWWW